MDQWMVQELVTWSLANLQSANITRRSACPMISLSLSCLRPLGDLELSRNSGKTGTGQNHLCNLFITVHQQVLSG